MMKENWRHPLVTAGIFFFNTLFPGKRYRHYLSRARFALNYIPDEEPFNAQTSTKFLEYAAMRIPVITTNYFWISEFKERYGGNYFILKEDLSNMDMGMDQRIFL